MAGAAAARLGISAHEVAVASTGVIGVPLPVGRIVAALAACELSADGWDGASRAILTTDTRPKVHEREVRLGGGVVRLGGIAKGAGMIHPDMATLLAFVTTDAEVAQEDLTLALGRAADATFNMISVDGDTSTNDTVLVLANGASGVRVDGADASAFEGALRALCADLALAIVADGEGVTKVFEIRLRGARNAGEARLAARTITDSNLVRTAIHGADPNWGRILAAAGRSGARVETDRASVVVGAVPVFASGAPVPFDAGAVRAHLSGPRIAIEVDLGLGDGAAVAWGADLSAEYVRINADYTT
jgi:glutamate N-acetyltransferase/amino-acid N-acetyltransferase